MRLSVLCIAAENVECRCSVEGTEQSAGEGASHIGDLAASVKHNMSTAWLQTTLIKNVIRGSISEIAHTKLHRGWRLADIATRSQSWSQNKGGGSGSWEALLCYSSGTSPGDMQECLGEGVRGSGRPSMIGEGRIRKVLCFYKCDSVILKLVGIGEAQLLRRLNRGLAYLFLNSSPT